VLNSSYRLLKFIAKLVSFTVLFFVALYVLIGRAALGILPDYQKDLEIILSEQIQMPVEINSISGRWVGFDPVIDINGLSVNGAENAYIGRARIRFSFLASIYALAPRFKSIVVEHSEFTVFQDDSGTWKAAGFEVPEKEGGSEADFSALNSILNGVAITLSDNTILLKHEQGRVQMLRLPAVNLSYLNDNFYASGKVLQEEGRKTLLSFSIEGHGVLSEQDIAGTLYLEARSAEFFDRVLKTYQWENVTIQDIDASARLWLSFDGLNIESIQGDVQVSKINWMVAEKSLPPIINTVMDVQIEGDEHNRQLMFSGLSFNWAGNTCNSSNVKILNKVSETEVRASQLDIKCISRLASAAGILSASLQERLDVSLPEGLLKNIKLTVRDLKAKNILLETLERNANDLNDQKVLPAALPIERFNFEAELDNVSSNAYSGTPSVKGIDGYIYADTKGGGVYFDSKRFELGFPELFTSTWRMKRTEGAISWKINNDDIFIYSEGLRLFQFDESLVYGDFFLNLNPIEKEDYLSLSLGMQDIPFTHASNFVPGLVVGENLNSWLNESLVSGVISEGVYIGHGSIESDSPDHSFTSSIYLKTNQGVLSFDDDWPNLEGLNTNIYLQNSELIISAERAKIKETELLDITAVMFETDAGEVDSLNIKATLLAGKSEQSYWLKESPISSHTEKIIEQIEIDGVLNVDLDLDIPLSDDKDIVYQIESSFESVDVKHIATDLSFKGVKGVLNVSSLTGVTAKGLTAEFLGQKANVSIETSTAEEKKSGPAFKSTKMEESDIALNSQTVISVDSEIPVGNLLNYYDQNEIIGLSGMLSYHAELNVPNQEGAYPKLTVSSDLKGVSYDSPAPFKKVSTEARNLALSLLIEPDKLDLNLSLKSENSPDIDSELLFVGNEFISGEILVGGAESKKMGAKGINVAANIDNIELQPWVEFIQKNVERLGSSDSEILQRIDLDVGALNAYGQNFKRSHAVIIKPKDAWQIDIKGKLIQGKIKIPSEDAALDIQFDHMFLESESSDKHADGGGASTNDTGILDPRKLPEITFSIKKLVKDKVNYGAWKTHVLPNDHGTVFKDIKGNIKGSAFDGQLNWKLDDSTEGKEAHTSILTMDIKGKRFEELTKAIGKDPLVSSEQFDASVSLVWPGGPAEFKLANVSGSVLLKMEDGFLNTEDAKTGALRVFGILNAESIMRRLKLDFSDLYKSGVGYDVLSVKTTINRGLLSFAEHLVIDGPSSSYLINGSVDLKKETLDMDMLVNLPVIQNLPLAALILGAPQIGGAVWLVDKLLGEPLSAITTARYDITGSWEKPNVKLNTAMNASKKDRSKQKNLR